MTGISSAPNALLNAGINGDSKGHDRARGDTSMGCRDSVWEWGETTWECSKLGQDDDTSM